jgi:hypothetical protein
MKNSSDRATITVHVPMTFVIHGGRKLIISDAGEKSGGGLSFGPPTHAPQQRTENALLKAVAKAHRWRRKIENGEYDSITELAKAENVNQSYACRILRLTLLAPAVVTAILNGRYSSDLMLKQIMKPLPVSWNEQCAQLSIENLTRRGHTQSSSPAE